MIQNLIIKEFICINDRINILYIKGNNQEFDMFLEKVFPNMCLLNFNETFYGINNPNIVINNEMSSETLYKSTEICKYFHIPLLMVFNDANDYKSPDIDIYFRPSNTIALSSTSNKMILKKYDDIMKFDIYNKNNIDKWRSYIINLCKKPFIITNENNEYHVK